MTRETGASPESKWPIINTLPDHEPTAEEFAAERQKHTEALLRISMQDGPARRIAERLLNHSPSFNQRMVRVQEQTMRGELAPLLAFRKQYEEGKISDEDMQILDEAAKRGSSYNSRHFDGDHSAAADKDELFRRAIIPAYLTFQDPNLVARAVHLVIQHGESHAYRPPFDIASTMEKLNEELPEYPEDDPQLAPDLIPNMISTIAEVLLGPQRSYKFTVEHGLAKAEYVYKDNNTFTAVEAFFAA